MAVIISPERIKQTIDNLHYAEYSVKHKFVDLIFKSYHKNTETASEPEPNDPDTIIKTIWNVSDPKEIAHKRKNFHSLKSSVNNDFQRLYRSGKNPDGIIIGDYNYFDISNEAKDTIFAKFASGSGKDRVINLEELMDVLKVIERAIESTDIEQKEIVSHDEFLGRLNQTLSTVVDKYGITDEQDAENLEEEAEEAEEDDVEEEEAEEEEDEEEGEEDEEEGEEDETEEASEDDEYEVIEEIIEEFEDEDEEEGEEEDQEDAEELEEVEDEGDIEDVEEDEEEDLDETEEEEEEEEEDYEEEIIEEDEELVEIIETGLPVNSLGIDRDDIYKDDGILKEKILLDEQLDGFLGTMERFYNQYLLIEEGRYIVGSKNPERHEIFRKKIMLPELYMGKFPVTNLLFSLFINKTGYITTAERLGFGIVYTGRFIKKINPNTGKTSVVLNSALSCKKESGACWHRPTGLGSDLNNKRDHPVVQVSIEDAVAYAKWINKRLPTEMEWEGSVRTQKGYKFPWGNTWKKDQCNIEATANADTTPVDQYRKWENELGIVDALGNVLEWTSSKKSVSQKLYYIAKGGSWISNQTPYLYQRFLYKKDYSSNIIGFRCVANS
ncbi:MAG: hypothetical protein OMM_01794 [Candidatus Magnetoglobus multicellularis str. Araruama]|uniref:Sulfatase-modifying factor enzyme-like domain-containing protein n=1 Tax=Candidatus Magnetoglobus multicellularis str. Araruama TaxID=890399 RepID=A0A1V1PC26_9BACT|nr:MAG: hypothetical protein OMM_01794 [Candidatus Magnetoglobus multicellularis str. Araruama]